jgi:hypothetical protein
LRNFHISFKQDLQLFAECIIAVGINSLDKYPSWMFEYSKSQEEIFDQDSLEIKELWERIKIKIDIEKSELINQKLNEMFTVFSNGENEKGRDIALDIYLMDVKILK